MQKFTPASLILDNGIIFHGQSFGYPSAANGEVVFSTAMVGYPESLTDPSYSGQILTVTYPLVGNYGVPEGAKDSDNLSLNYESEHIHVRALIVSDYSIEHSHWNARKSLAQWLNEEKIPALTGIDTRYLTQILRENGAMKGKIVFQDENEIDFMDPNLDNQVDFVSCKEVISYHHHGEGLNPQKRIILMDCGVKHNILRCLLRRGLDIVRVPWDYDFTGMQYDGLFISNGPGNPNLCEKAVENIRVAMAADKPIFGICMGNQLLSKAAGANVYKLKYGHRSHNQPVRMLGTNTCFITSQNHGFAVDESTLGSDWEPFFQNMNDGTNEGIRHKSRPFFSVQFHPEASSGPTDTGFLFDDFVKML